MQSTKRLLFLSVASPNKIINFVKWNEFTKLKKNILPPTTLLLFLSVASHNKILVRISAVSTSRGSEILYDIFGTQQFKITYKIAVFICYHSFD